MSKLTSMSSDSKEVIIPLPATKFNVVMHFDECPDLSIKALYLNDEYLVDADEMCKWIGVVLDVEEVKSFLHLDSRIKVDEDGITIEYASMINIVHTAKRCSELKHAMIGCMLNAIHANLVTL